MQYAGQTLPAPRALPAASEFRGTAVAAQPGGLPTQDGSKTDYLFVNNVRFWSMVGIVALHCLQAWGNVGGTGSRNLQAGLIQLFKFGTICFYFISGFLLGDHFEEGRAGKYLFRRIRSTAGPWAIWASLFAVLTLSDLWLRGWPGRGMGQAATIITSCMYGVLFNSTYWFVPNLLLSLGILVLFRRFLNDWRFGCILLLTSLSYAANIYEHWGPTRHTSALLGFVFYQWLGVWVSRHMEVVWSRVTRLQPHTVAALILVAGGIAFAEARHLSSIRPGEDAFNTLRISNQLYSLAVLLGLLRLRSATWPAFVDVRRHTYGLYLIHGISLFMLIRLIQLVGRVAFGLSPWTLMNADAAVWRSPGMSLLMWVAMFGAVYGSSLALSIYLAERTKYSWAVGQRARSAATDQRWSGTVLRFSGRQADGLVELLPPNEDRSIAELHQARS